MNHNFALDGVGVPSIEGNIRLVSNFSSERHAEKVYSFMQIRSRN